MFYALALALRTACCTQGGDAILLHVKNDGMHASRQQLSCATGSDVRANHD